MVIAIIGENCSGKSTLAKEIQQDLTAEIVTGKDYLRLAKSESEAGLLFKEKLKEAMKAGHIIYIISEKDHIQFLPEGAIKIHVQADLATIKERFSRRMKGHLPLPVEKMLESKSGSFDNGDYDFVFDGVSGNSKDLLSQIEALL